ncbi:MAG TPA: hypothetical protein DIW47_06265 [Bacteroidetes bacterium]|nr:hypothetical protein [Bacteroidota bacterium]
MNEFNNLKPDDAALRLFFKEDTLYGTQLPLENPAIPVFEGGKNATLLMIFSHNSEPILAGDWGTMVSGLIQNERAMNLKLDEVCLLNLQRNPDMTPESIFAAFPAKKVLVWGKTGIAQLDALPVFGSGLLFGKTVYKLNEAATYLSKEAKGDLWQFIKSQILV